MTATRKGEDRRRRYEDPISVEATPEQLIRAVANTPQKKSHEWKFMRKSKQSKR